MEGWNRACDDRDGKGTGRGTYNPLGHDEFCRRFLYDLAYYEYDIRSLCWYRQNHVDWDDVWRQQQQRREREGCAKGKGNRQAEDTWPAGDHTRQRER